MFKKVLVLAPHTDDGELGCGATIAKMLRNGAKVFYVAFSACEESVPEGMPKDVLKTELLRATTQLGISKDDVFVLNYKVRHFSEERQSILDDMIAIKATIDPDIVFIPSPHDVHQDHATIAKEGLRAFKKTTILAYEEPWNNYTFNNQAFVTVSEEDVKKKISALAEYHSQKGRPYIVPEYTIAQLKLHGVQIGVEYAEVFEVPRIVL